MQEGRAKWGAPGGARQHQVLRKPSPSALSRSASAAFLEFLQPKEGRGEKGALSQSGTASGARPLHRPHTGQRRLLLLLTLGIVAMVGGMGTLARLGCFSRAGGAAGQACLEVVGVGNRNGSLTRAAWHEMRMSFRSFRKRAEQTRLGPQVQKRTSPVLPPPGGGGAAPRGSAQGEGRAGDQGATTLVEGGTAPGEGGSARDERGSARADGASPRDEGGSARGEAGRISDAQHEALGSPDQERLGRKVDAEGSELPMEQRNGSDNDGAAGGNVGAADLSDNAANMPALPPYAGIYHEGYDERELFRRAVESNRHETRVPDRLSETRKPRRLPKIAFLFLTRGPLPMAPLWERFFQSADQLVAEFPALQRLSKRRRVLPYSVYIHTAKGFNYTEEHNLPQVFKNRQIPSENIKWGTVSMIDAERRLLAQALLDPLNARFVLVSDSCIPLFNFSFVFHYLLDTQVSFLRGANYKGATGNGRWNPGFLPLVPVSKWRKGNQWFALTREAAWLVTQDTLYYSKFRDHCKSCPRAHCNPPACYSDEHYIQTLLYNTLPDSKLANRSVTWIDWSRGGPHPMHFEAWEVGPRVLKKVRARPHCDWNGREQQWCYLIARKFNKDTVWALEKWAYMLGY